MNPSIKSLPPEFLSRLQKIYAPARLAQVHQGLSQAKPTTFRINTLKSNTDLVVNDLRKWDLEVVPHPLIPLAFELKKGSFKKLTSTKSYEEGWIYLQSYSSQIPPIVLNPQPGERVLDMCASPGGKTCQMAAMMKNEGEIIALEPENIRFDKLVANVKKQGATMVNPIKTRGEKFNSQGLFDKILLDAPCSSEGTFVATDRQSYAHWSPKLVEELSKLQKKLLAQAINLLKPGGLLLYSTCALSTEENEGILDALLLNDASIKVVPIKQTYPFLRPSTTKGAFRIDPSATMEGFFISLIHKL